MSPKSRTLLALAASFCMNVSSAQSLPQVDLGYEIHQAISYNVRDLEDLNIYLC